MAKDNGILSPIHSRFRVTFNTLQFLLVLLGNTFELQVRKTWNVFLVTLEQEAAEANQFGVKPLT